jgi:hypothetical protein
MMCAVVVDSMVTIAQHAGLVNGNTMHKYTHTNEGRTDEHTWINTKA